ncbi:Mpo1-like protein [Legionella nagasakiensis]|uniref:Mpo1-like protein n=1 Tax=Legionella nagasakiensis TaxID=535290 RepID=UPI0010567DC3|nr:Mpo1-like protein [Legionella nagasakiensis]
MKSFTEQAKWYAEYHQKKATLYTHMVGVPIIILSLMILLGFVHVYIPGILDIKLADLAVLALLIYYFRLNWLLALITLPLFALLLWIADLFNYAGPTSFALWSFVILLVLGCFLQLVGHFIEGKRPALTDNFWQALVAPLFLLAELFFLAGKMQTLKEEIHGEESTSTPIDTK